MKRGGRLARERIWPLGLASSWAGGSWRGSWGTEEVTVPVPFFLCHSFWEVSTVSSPHPWCQR